MDWTQFMSFIGIPGFTIATGIAWKAWDRAGQVATEANTRIAAVEAAANKRVTDLHATLTKFQVEVANNYASVAYLKDVEQRLLDDNRLLRTMIEKLDAKIDRFLPRGHGE